MNIVRLAFCCITAALLSLGALFYFSTYDPEKHMLMRARVYSDYDPLEHCVTPFGVVLGYSNGVPAFSNCISTFKTTYVNYVNLMNPLDVGRRGDPSETTVIMLGVRYTAMDFYIRWMAWNRGLVPRLVEDTSQFWKTNSFYNPAKTAQDWEAVYITNYAEATDVEERRFNAPRKADAILYNQDSKILPDGHIAVIVKVEGDVEAAGGTEKFNELKKLRLHPRRVYVAEQNFKNEDWGGKNYSRILTFQWRQVKTGTTYEGFLTDPDSLSIIGFVRVGKPLPLRELSDPYDDALRDDGGDL
ncbi:hypothetical protein ABB37_05459 [Leptomonas pyrrhocoris]|uniref:Peptidase C51 domain-containing protein n=1 Tax=Leptomonas pyrrhocoris TaxID=157538 RepID=A0A0N0DV74_LEPPY|nr:hypothetical protein ABB37_05459 [Leptomonas pyrrhocoris]XP_015658121.1 hypothetical protein ABB37_05459 [Leptomonas pyrrhocoris]KPA79681.1 hypothetical protein ABB37_05459 [Leptomonas pyrrhocoris]KPA79682.1 hypothetical protein ABB37_05459 [Leptomonas pyrrhocoris]|eukprot:XP_015658120.1 hypothetical protein ABB37_05459 [Leptomonas pyrrhocoris]